jgi:hypothetical protein
MYPEVTRITACLLGRLDDEDLRIRELRIIMKVGLGLIGRSKSPIFLSLFEATQRKK